MLSTKEDGLLTPNIATVSVDASNDHDTADDTAGSINIPDAGIKTENEMEGDKTTSPSRKDEQPKQEYMTGLPFVITFGSLMLAALLSALNASMISTVGSPYASLDF